MVTDQVVAAEAQEHRGILLIIELQDQVDQVLELKLILRQEQQTDQMEV
jgi:hypothetical protein